MFICLMTFLHLNWLRVAYQRATSHTGVHGTLSVYRDPGEEQSTP